MTVSRRAKFPAVIAREGGRSSIRETSEMESRSRNVLDNPLEPVIGRAEGETLWRGMTIVKADCLGCDSKLAAPRVARKGEAWWGRKKCYHGLKSMS
jgi:hypothetical protein